MARVHVGGDGGADYRTARQSTGSIAAGGEANVTVTWSTPFADTNYTVAPSVVRDAGGNDLQVRRIRTISATQVVVNVVNNDALNARTGTLHLIAIHD